MAIDRTGNAGFDAAVAAAEMIRQTAISGASFQGAADMVSCNYFAAVIEAGQAYGVATLSENVAFEVLRCGPLIGARQPQLFTIGVSAIGGPDVLG